MSPFVMAAEHCVCDQKHKESESQSHGAEEVSGRKGEGFSWVDRGCKLWEETERKTHFTHWWFLTTSSSSSNFNHRDEVR